MGFFLATISLMVKSEKKSHFGIFWHDSCVQFIYIRGMELEELACYNC